MEKAIKNLWFVAYSKRYFLTMDKNGWFSGKQKVFHANSDSLGIGYTTRKEMCIDTVKLTALLNTVHNIAYSPSINYSHTLDVELVN
jgi:hypothetical protein